MLLIFPPDALSSSPLSVLLPTLRRFWCLSSLLATHTLDAAASSADSGADSGALFSDACYGVDCGSHGSYNNSCSDANDSCLYWTGQGQCESSPTYMNENCRLSCGVCSLGAAQCEATAAAANTSQTFRRLFDICPPTERTCSAAGAAARVLAPCGAAGSCIDDDAGLLSWLQNSGRPGYALRTAYSCEAAIFDRVPCDSSFMSDYCCACRDAGVSTGTIIENGGMDVCSVPCAEVWLLAATKCQMASAAAFSAFEVAAGSAAKFEACVAAMQQKLAAAASTVVMANTLCHADAEGEYNLQPTTVNGRPHYVQSGGVTSHGTSSAHQLYWSGDEYKTADRPGQPRWYLDSDGDITGYFAYIDSEVDHVPTESWTEEYCHDGGWALNTTMALTELLSAANCGEIARLSLSAPACANQSTEPLHACSLPCAQVWLAARGRCLSASAAFDAVAPAGLYGTCAASMQRELSRAPPSVTVSDTMCSPTAEGEYFLQSLTLNLHPYYISQQGWHMYWSHDELWILDINHDDSGYVAYDFNNVPTGKWTGEDCLVNRAGSARFAKNTTLRLVEHLTESNCAAIAVSVLASSECGTVTQQGIHCSIQCAELWLGEAARCRSKAAAFTAAGPDGLSAACTETMHVELAMASAAIEVSGLQCHAVANGEYVLQPTTASGRPQWTNGNYNVFSKRDTSEWYVSTSSGRERDPNRDAAVSIFATFTSPAMSNASTVELCPGLNGSRREIFDVSVTVTEHVSESNCRDIASSVLQTDACGRDAVVAAPRGACPLSCAEWWALNATRCGDHAEVFSSMRPAFLPAQCDSDVAANVAACDGIVSEMTDAGNLADGVGGYGHGASCQWILRCSEPDTHPVLHFSIFEFETSYDYLTLYDGSSSQAAQLVQLTGFAIPQDASATGAQMTVVVSSDFGSGGYELMPIATPCREEGHMLTSGRECSDAARILGLPHTDAMDPGLSPGNPYTLGCYINRGGRGLFFNPSGVAGQCTGVLDCQTICRREDQHDAVDPEGFEATFSCINFDRCQHPPLIDCGSHGQCVDGGCACTGGYSGPRCAILPPWISPSGCDWNSLPDAVLGINRACCLGLSADVPGVAVPPDFCEPGTAQHGCSVACAVALLPLVNGSCAPLLAVLFDHSDGTRDGRATVLDEAASRCTAMPPTEAITALAALRNAGNCAANAVALDGVAEVAVGARSCTDALDPTQCGAMLATGVFSCAADFCVGPGCTMARQCDATCKICGGDGGVSSGHRRALQQSTVCDPAEFATEAAAVTADCCDDAGDDCSGGVAASCDALCATSYVDFFARCQFALAAFAHDLMPEYTALNGACTSLPVGALVSTIARCELPGH